MRKFLKSIILFCFAATLFFIGGLLADHYVLQDKLIRLHVVGNSNSTIDQSYKLAVRDTVLDYLNSEMCNISSTDDAREYLLKNTTEIEQLVNNKLAQLNSGYSGCVSLQQEAFDMRAYDTFTLPSGVYTALKVELGEANGKNWWCVAFPSLCIPKTSEEFLQAAVEAGIGEDLADTVSNNGEYSIRFFFLECMGKLEKFLCSF